jgi:hypothetical protein
VQFAEIYTFLNVQIELQDMTDACIGIEFVIDVKSTVRYSNSFCFVSGKIKQCVLEDGRSSHLETYKNGEKFR